jgi:beta-phosphoglucomutase-like phosphatase (HAD superfamily)
MRFHGAAWQKMLAENGIETDAHDFLVKTAGKTNREIIPNFFKDASEERLLELGLRKETIYRELFLPERRAIEGAIEFLTEAQKLGVKMAVATAAPIANMEFARQTASRSISEIGGKAERRAEILSGF